MNSTRWNNLSDRFEALNKRERWLVIIAIACLYYALYSFTLAPLFDQKKKMHDELVQEKAHIAEINKQISALKHAQLNAEDTPERKQINRLKRNINALDKQITTLKTTLISPNKMPDLLSDLLAKNKNLTLVNLKTLPVRGLLRSELKKKNIQQKQNLPIFKHSVEMTVEGRYLDLLKYVRGVEGMPWNVLWDNAKLTVETEPKGRFPLSQLTLSVYTLSLDKNWLSI